MSTKTKSTNQQINTPSPLHPLTPSPVAWDAFVDAHPAGHLLQTSAWGELKSRFGWRAEPVAVADGSGDLVAGSLLLYRKMAGLTLAYAPKGPLTDWGNRPQTDALLAALRAKAKRNGAAFLKIEPDLPDTAENQNLLTSYGFRPSPQTVQPRSTIVLDISGDEDEILARMKSKWRYNIRLAGRKGVVVHEGSRADLAHFADLMATTGERDNFDVHSADYYAAAYDLLVSQERAVFLYATFEGNPLASIVVTVTGRMACYLWGASSNRERNRMPNHALQWAGMQWAKTHGAQIYDLWGIPDPIGQLAVPLPDARMAADTVPVNLDDLPEGDLWGVFRFKQGFGGHVTRTVGAWDLALSPVLYAAYKGGLGIRQMANGEWRNRIAAYRSSIHPSPFAIRHSHTWQSTLSTLPTPHVLQSWEWGAVKAQTGWVAERIAMPGAAFQFLWRQPVPGIPLRVAYVPKGPVVDWDDPALVESVLDAIQAHARRRLCLFVKIDPDLIEDSPAGQRLLDSLRRRGWRFSADQIQFKNTGFSDLRPDEETILAGMKSKWRYNIRLAEKRGITVRAGDASDFAAFHALYAETGERDGFLIRPYDYYATTWRTFLDAENEAANPAGGVLLLAEHPEEGQPLAGLFLMRYGQRAWYFYGASSDLRRRDMPNHLLQWEAMRWAKAAGCTVYDWWGAPTRPEDEDDAMQGVWRFKEGFGAELRVHVGAWDWPVSSVLYDLYTQAMPKVMARLRQMR
ncbi:MAG: peptidoglycan bridge formation glycyltransferase FemA/FemB family protein [Caldilineaceae bacterium]|nr:peptidoglycan bridge formation glycyltransferase FemA/FemB family protein [Caldilineaceae bacterium]MBP9072416.1 peptidoglycan bridge formation glycyltransferase FemA/FemB family protein [Caldilineaceae bacterium]